MAVRRSGCERWRRSGGGVGGGGIVWHSGCERQWWRRRGAAVMRGDGLTRSERALNWGNAQCRPRLPRLGGGGGGGGRWRRRAARSRSSPVFFFSSVIKSKVSGVGARVGRGGRRGVSRWLRALVHKCRCVHAHDRCKACGQSVHGPGSKCDAERAACTEYWDHGKTTITHPR